MTLADWRRRIDEIDRKLVELLNERSQCALEIGKIKQAEHLPLYQPDREREVLENAEKANPGPLSDAAIRRLFERIIDEADEAGAQTVLLVCNRGAVPQEMFLNQLRRIGQEVLPRLKAHNITKVKFAEGIG